MKKLTMNEEIFLLAIWHLNEDAYGVKIRERVIETTGSSLLLGTLYNTLDQLIRKGYVLTRKGEPTSQRGGHNKVYYELSEVGSTALQKSRELREKLWNDVPDNAFIKPR